MRIQHTVVFRLRHARGTAEEAAFLDTAHRVLSSIPGVEDFLVSRQVSRKSRLQWQFSMSFADQSRYDAYDQHAAHQDFVKTRWIPEVESFQEYDFSAAASSEA